MRKAFFYVAVMIFTLVAFVVTLTTPLWLLCCAIGLCPMSWKGLGTTAIGVAVVFGIYTVIGLIGSAFGSTSVPPSAEASAPES